MQKMRKTVTGIAVSAMMLMSALPLTPDAAGNAGSLIASITAEAADYSEAYHYRTINNEVYLYASGLIYKITKKAGSTTSPGTLSIVGVHSSAARAPYSYQIKVPSYIKYASRRYDITSVGEIREYGNYLLNNSHYQYLKSIDLSACTKLTELEDAAFYICQELSSVKLPSTVKKIGSYAFGFCPKLTSVVLPSSLEWIGDNAFHNSGVTSVTFTNSNPNVFHTGKRIFGYTDKLTNINVANNGVFGALLRDSALAGASKLTKLNNMPFVTYKMMSNGYTKPSLSQNVYVQMQKYFPTVDKDRIAFFEEYFKAYRRYIAKSVTVGYATDGQKIKALHDWVCNQVEYAYLPDGVTPDHGDYCHVDSSVFFSNKTVCDGYSRALKLLLDEVGIEAYVLHTDSSSLADDEDGHAWVMVKMGGYYFHIDACHDDDDYDSNRNGSRIDYDHFLKSDKDIKTCPFGHQTWVYSNCTHAIYGPSRISGNYPSMQQCRYSLGDANKDGKVTIADVNLIYSYVSNPKTTIDITLADMDMNGRVNGNDAALLRNRYGI